MPRLPEVTQVDAGDTSLRGLLGVAVMAEETSHDMRRRGLTQAWLEERVTRLLERDSIPLMTRAAATSSPRSPLLVVRLQTVEHPERATHAWNLSLALYQKVSVPGADSTRVLAPTWQANSTLGVSAVERIRASVGASLDLQAEEFVRAWRAQVPGR